MLLDSIKRGVYMSRIKKRELGRVDGSKYNVDNVFIIYPPTVRSAEEALRLRKEAMDTLDGEEDKGAETIAEIVASREFIRQNIMIEGSDEEVTPEEVGMLPPLLLKEIGELLQEGMVHPLQNSPIGKTLQNGIESEEPSQASNEQYPKEQTTS